MNINKENLYSISQPGIYIFITKHFGKILSFAFLLMLIVAITYQENLNYITRLFHIIIVLSVAGFIVDRFLRKVAYKIIIDFDESTIEFYMCRSKETKKYDFHLIKSISIKKYVTFVLANGKILYNLGKDECFNRSIDRLKSQAGKIYKE